MILIDTSVWIDHLAKPLPHLVALIEASTAPRLLTHPFVIGELACGQFPTRRETLVELRRLARVVEASHDDVLALIEHHNLMGRGVGLIDMHLLASTLITPDARLWTHDNRLARIADELDIAYQATTLQEE